MGGHVHEGPRKPFGFWRSPKVAQVFEEFAEGKIKREDAYRRLDISHYREAKAAETFDWYFRKYLRNRRKQINLSTEDAIAPERVVIGEGGRLVIPASYRQILALKEGEEVIVRLEQGELRILTPRQALQRAQMLVRRHVPASRSLVDELIEERRQEARGE